MLLAEGSEHLAFIVEQVSIPQSSWCVEPSFLTLPPYDTGFNNLDTFILYNNALHFIFQKIQMVVLYLTLRGTNCRLLLTLRK